MKLQHAVAITLAFFILFSLGLAYSKAEERNKERVCCSRVQPDVLVCTPGVDRMYPDAPTEEWVTYKARF